MGKRKVDPDSPGYQFGFYFLAPLVAAVVVVGAIMAVVWLLSPDLR